MKGKFPIMGLNRWDRQDRYSHMIILYDSYRCKHISFDFQTGEACFSIDCSSTRVFSRESFRRRNAASCHESTAPSNFTLALPWLPWAPVQWVSSLTSLFSSTVARSTGGLLLSSSCFRDNVVVVSETTEPKTNQLERGKEPRAKRSIGFWEWVRQFKIWPDDQLVLNVTIDPLISLYGQWEVIKRRDRERRHIEQSRDIWKIFLQSPQGQGV